MITTGKIVERISDSTYKVYLPIFQNAGVKSNLNTSIYTANCCVDPFVYRPYNVDDLVFVGFVNNRISQPIILGKILKDGIDKSSSYLYVDSMKVENSMVLPTDTSIVSSDGQESHLFSLKFLEQQLNQLDTLADKIDLINQEGDEDYEELEERIEEVYNTLNKGITDITTEDEGKLVSIDSDGNFNPTHDKGLLELSSSDSGKLVILDNNGDLATTSNKNLTSITSSDVNKILSVDNNGDISPVANKGLFNLSSADSGKILSVDSDGNIEPILPTYIYQLYQHNLYIKYSYGRLYFSIISNNENAISLDDAQYNLSYLLNYLRNNGVVDSKHSIQASGNFSAYIQSPSYDENSSIIGVYVDNNIVLNVIVGEFNVVTNNAINVDMESSDKQIPSNIIQELEDTVIRVM